MFIMINLYWCKLVFFSIFEEITMSGPWHLLYIKLLNTYLYSIFFTCCVYLYAWYYESIQWRNYGVGLMFSKRKILRAAIFSIHWYLFTFSTEWKGEFCSQEKQPPRSSPRNQLDRLIVWDRESCIPFLCLFYPVL